MESDQLMARQTPPRMLMSGRRFTQNRVGRWYATLVSDDHKRRLGQYLTPVGVAMFMAMLYQSGDQQQVRMLDPGAGSGVLACALLEVLASRKERPSSIELIAYEIDPKLTFCLEACLSYANQWLARSNIRLQFIIIKRDFVLDHAEVLERTQRLFTEQATGGNTFDAIIANPPYFKIPKSDLRARAAAAVVHGQPNLYALFMAVSAQLLKPYGQMIIITPRSYAAGPYFRRFREHFFTVMRPESIHLFSSRRDAFNRDNILQENVILHAKKIADIKEIQQNTMVQVSISAGATDLTQLRQRRVPLTEIFDLSSRDKMLRIPVDDVDDETCRTVRSWPGRLHAYGMEISTGPVVPFRAVSFLDQDGQSPESTRAAPLDAECSSHVRDLADLCTWEISIYKGFSTISCHFWWPIKIIFSCAGSAPKSKHGD